MLEEKSMPQFYWVEGVGTRVIFREEVELTTLEGIREYCLCACARSEAKEARPEVGEVHISRLFTSIEGL